MSESHNAADTPDRKTVADHLYKDRGPQEASSRCDANSRYGSVDLCAEMLARLKLQPGATVCDIGCGSGQHLVRFTEAVGDNGTARGFDFSPQAVENTRKRGLTADVADGASIPVPDAYTDAISCSYAIYYFPDLAAAMAEWHRILKPGGRVAISGPAADTNAELYEFHHAVTGGGLADVDKLSLGYVADRLPQALGALGFREIRVDTLTNPINFPTADEFIDYWTNTSLFARGVPESDREQVIAEGRARLQGKTGPFPVTKRVSVCSAVR